MSEGGKKTHSLEFCDLAGMQIEQAIDCFLKQNLEGFVCATTLAHAACGLIEPELKDDSVFVQMKLRLRELIPDLDSIPLGGNKDKATYILNMAANAYKHRNEEYCEKDIDPQIFARISLSRAIAGFEKLTGKYTDKMTIYVQKIASNQQEAA